MGIMLLDERRFSQVPPLRCGSRLRSGRDDIWERLSLIPIPYSLIPIPYAVFPLYMLYSE